MMEEKEQSRLALAQQFFDLATGASPAAIRASLSRLYYANYHLAVLLTGGTSHGDIAKRLGQDISDLGVAFKRMQAVRCKMDYAPNELAEMKATDLRLFYEEELSQGSELFYKLSEQVALQEGANV